jgi:hypothetical protein
VTGKELAEMLSALAQQASEEARGYSEAKRTPEWWVIQGYASILTDAAGRVAAHSRRAMRAYQSHERVVAVTGLAPNAKDSPIPNAEGSWCNVRATPGSKNQNRS